MSAIGTPPLLTTADLLAMPDDGMERWLIQGQLREKPMTKRNRFHAALEARIAQLVGEWLDRQPAPRGEVFAGEVGCILQHDPSTTVGIDVAYFSAEVLARQSKQTTQVDGAPVLAVEILSPNDTEEETDEKVASYLAANVALVWLIDPYLKTVQVIRPDAEPVLFNVTQELTADPHLRDFRVSVARIFSR
jgi:Uma2 family endonuclease